MKKLIPVLFLLLGFNCNSQTKSFDLQLIKCESHPMQYYLSLPKNWSKNKAWPVVVVLEAADKEYKINAERFIAARGDMPFILVAPFNTNNGNQGRRDSKIFPYSIENWDYMDKVGDCQFNEEGLQNVLKELASKYNGEQKFFLTGFEAGTHVLWSVVFNHPEWLKAAAPVAGNFRNRCVEASKISSDPSRKSLPIKSFVGEKDEYLAPSGKFYNQWTEVKSVAASHGFENISESVLPGKGHAPMPEEVMNYFNSLLKK